MLLLLDPYVDVILALALAYLSLQIVKALFGPLNGLPVVGSAIASAEHAITKSVTSFCGSVVHGADIAVGNSLHGIASMVNRLAGAIRHPAQILDQASTAVLGLSLAYHGLRELAHGLNKTFTGIDATVRTLGREFHGIEHRVRVIEHDIARGIGHDLRIGLQATEKELSHLERRVIPGIRSDVATADTAISNLYEWAKGKADLIGIGTFAAAVTAVIGKDLLQLFKCPTFLNKTLGRGCGLWNGLEDLFGLLLDGFIFADLCAIIPEVEVLFSEFEEPLTALIADAADAFCAQPPPGWPTIPSRKLATPTVTLFTLSNPAG